jgi:hypothetical protein
LAVRNGGEEWWWVGEEPDYDFGNYRVGNIRIF